MQEQSSSIDNEQGLWEGSSPVKDTIVKMSETREDHAASNV